MATTIKAKVAPKKAVKRKKPTRIFSHKGRVGIAAGDDLLADPSKPGNIGCIVLVKNVEITQEAYDILSRLPKASGSAAPIMCYDSSAGPCFGWYGGLLHIVGKDPHADRDFKPTLLKKRIKTIRVPDAFKTAVEEL